MDVSGSMRRLGLVLGAFVAAALRIDNPRVQPYGAFTTGEIATLGVEALIEKFVAEKMGHIIGGALRAQAEREAREEVERALASYGALQAPAPAALTEPKE